MLSMVGEEGFPTQPAIRDEADDIVDDGVCQAGTRGHINVLQDTGERDQGVVSNQRKGGAGALQVAVPSVVGIE